MQSRVQAKGPDCSRAVGGANPQTQKRKTPHELQGFALSPHQSGIYSSRCRNVRRCISTSFLVRLLKHLSIKPTFLKGCTQVE